MQLSRLTTRELIERAEEHYTMHFEGDTKTKVYFKELLDRCGVLLGDTVPSNTYPNRVEG